MSNYLTLTKMLIKNIFKRDKTKKSSKLYWLLYGVLALSYLMLAAIAVLAIAIYSQYFVQLELQNEFVMMLLLMGVVFVLIFGIIGMLSYLYFSRDTEFFLSLPIKSSTVYLSKLSIVYLTELVTSALIFIPCLITAGVVMAMPAVFFITMILAVFLVPAISLFIASILAIPLMYIVSFFKKRGALSSIVVILLFGAVFVAYYAVILSFSSSVGDFTDQIVIIEGMKHVLINLSNAFYPLYALVKFATMTPVYGLSVGVSMLVNLGIFIACIAALVTLAIFISSAVYSKGAASQLEGSKSKQNAKATYTQSGAFMALVKKEWKELIRTPAFAFQCLSGIVLCPIVVIFMNFMGGGISGELPIDAATFSSINWFVSIGIMVMLGIGASVAPCTCVTREGDKYYYMKLIPVDYKTQLRAKSVVYIMISAITLLISVIAFSFMSFNLLFIVLAFLFLQIYNYGFVNFAMYFDLLNPKLDWVTPNEAMKHNRNATLPVLINMGASAFIIAVPIILTMLVTGWLGILISWIVLFAIAITLAVTMRLLLVKNCVRLIERL